ncbi:MAG: DNA polymerase III subunit beta [Clostridiales bacterium]|nr:DNA polymerase III subunit beta [Clostridiales bacterium]
MKLYLDVKELNAGIQSVIKAMPVRTVMPVLDGIYVEATAGGIRLRCSDLMMQKECFLPATVEEEGACVIPGKLFSEYVRKLPDAIVQLSLDGAVLTIQCGKTQNQLQSIECEEFPEMRFAGDAFSLNLPSVVCKEMILSTVFATSVDDSKPVLSGAFAEVSGDKMTLVATDAYQFAMYTWRLPAQSEERTAILQGKALTEIARMMDEAKEEVEMVFSKTHVKVDLGHTCLVSRLLDGNYIDYKRILPKESSTRVLLSRLALMEAIDRAQLVAREGNNHIVLSFSDEVGTISAQSYVGKFHDELEIQMTGENLEIAFNPKYCMNILKSMEDENIYMEFNGSINPCVVRQVQEEKQYYLIVPMRIY